MLRLHGAERPRERGPAGLQQQVLGAVPLRRGLLLLPRWEEGAPAGGAQAPQDRRAAGLAQPDSHVLRAGLQRHPLLSLTQLQRPAAAGVRSDGPQHHHHSLRAEIPLPETPHLTQVA